MRGLRARLAALALQVAVPLLLALAVGAVFLVVLVMGALLVLVGVSQSWSVALAILNMSLISALMAMGLNLQWGFAGLFNVGLMGFVALGGLAVVLVSTQPVSAAWAAADDTPAPRDRRRRKRVSMFSSTTMALSTNIPKPMTMPAMAI